MMELPKKNLRLREYEYDRSGAYFVTLCTHNRQNLFGELIASKEEAEKIGNGYPSDYTVGADSISARMVAKIYYEMIDKQEGYKSLGFVVMPDHVHMLISIVRADMESAHTEIPRFMQEFKRYTTIKYIQKVKSGVLLPFDKHVWQKNYYEHVIRNKEDLKEAQNYIRINPKAWLYKNT